MVDSEMGCMKYDVYQYQCATYITKFYIWLRNTIQTEVRGEIVDDADDGVLLAEDAGGQPGDGHAGVAVHLPHGGRGVGTEAQVRGTELRGEEEGDDSIEQVWEVMFCKPSGANTNISNQLSCQYKSCVFTFHSWDGHQAPPAQRQGRSWRESSPAAWRDSPQRERPPSGRQPRSRSPSISQPEQSWGLEE